MTFIRRVHTIDSHTAGEPTRVVVDGFPELAGATLAEREADLLANHADLARMLVGEPRGHAPLHAVLPLPTSHPRADLSILILSSLGSLTMCGHALIGTVTTLVETLRIQPTEPVTTVVVETLSGLVTAHARVEGAKVRSVTFQGVPSWVAVTGLEVEVGGGTFEVDIAFGGIWFALVRVEQTGLRIEVESIPTLVALSHRIRLAANRVLAEGADWPPGTPDGVDQLLYFGRPASRGADGQNMATSTGLGFDRSPCGTGSCARMAWHFARGDLKVGDTFIHESVLNTKFTGTVEAETEVGGRRAIVPRITGSAYITGFNQLVLDSRDPLGEGIFIPAAGGT
ncbi:MAG: proline racemase family protein [bacterium]|nr:proline racemase family protein [Acidimicrobiia bacterium]MCY4651138.1 proline racemase family protein [bacterium]